MTEATPTGVPDLLQGLVSRFGPDVLTHRRRVLGTLADHMPGTRREMHLLAAALDEGVPGRLSGGAASPGDVERESRRLCDSRGLAPDLARWTVSVLAQALGAPGTIPTSVAPAPPVAPSASAGPQPAAAPPTPVAGHGKHARFWRFVRIGGPLIVLAFGLVRFLASLPS